MLGSIYLVFESSLKSDREVLMVFQGIFQVSTFKSVSKSFKSISQKFQGYFKEDRRVFQRSFQWVSWAFDRIAKGILGKFQRYFQGV